MRKLLSLIFAVTAIVAGARQVSPDEAAAIASDFLNSSSVQRAPRRVTVQRAKPAYHQAEAPFYVFNADDNHGFVIVSGDDRARKILGYSDTGAFDFNNLPPQLAAMLEQYAKQIETLSASASTDPSWSAPAAAPASTDGILLETANWGQGYPYNAQCPVIDGVQAPTGCVATAMAIVMKYHNWPLQPFGENIYYLNGDYRRYNYNDVTFDWAQMPNTLNYESTESAKTEVGELMAAAGHSVEMNYYPYESGSYAFYIGHALRYHFKYDESCEFIHRSDYTNAEWKDILHSEINEGRPVIYQGAGIGNHAFICDGYMDEDFFHFNWGWDGIDNGYFALNELTPGGFNFSMDYSMIKGIKPDTHWKEYSQAYVDNNYSGYSHNIGGHGAIITTENIVKGEPFTFVCNYLTLPAGVNGKYGIAIIGKDGEIKEIIEEKPFSIRNDRREEIRVLFKDCIVNETPEEGDFVQIVTNDIKNNKWLLVKGVSNAPSKVHTHNNIVRTSHVKLIKDSPIGYFYSEGVTEYEPGEYDIPVGLTISFDCTRKELLDAGFHDSHTVVIVNHNGRETCYYERELDNNIYESLVIDGGNYEVTIHSGPLGSKSINLLEAGTLSSMVDYISAGETKELKVSGPINSKDLEYITSAFEYVKSLDLSEAYIVADDVNSANILQSGSFFSKRHLEGINLPMNLQKICSGAFYNCPISALNIPETVTEIESSAFLQEVSLTGIMVHWIQPIDIPLDAFELAEIADRCTLYVPIGTSKRYQSHEVWSRFSNIIEKDDFDLLPIDYSANGIIYRLYNSNGTAIISGYNSSLPAKVIIPSNIEHLDKEFIVKEIAGHAFANSKIEYLIMPSSIERLGEYSFEYCTHLKEVVLSPSLKTIPLGCFTYCYALEIADLPEGLEYIGWGGFDTASSLKQLHLPAKLLLDPNGSFYGLSSCTSLTVDESNPYYKSVDNILYTKDGAGLVLVAGARKGSVVIPQEVTQLPWRTFYYMPYITEIVVPHHFDSVPYQFVINCPLLKHITLPDDAVSTNSETISLCESLESITIGRKMKTAMGIHDNPSLKYVYLRNENVLNIPVAFNGSYYTEYVYFTDQITNNVVLDNCERFYVPGKCSVNFNSLPSTTINELWRYELDKEDNKVYIKPLIEDIVIDEVIINGKKAVGNGYIYGVNPAEQSAATGKATDNLDVVVNYTLHGRQAMSTHYTSEFNAALESGIFIPGDVNEDGAIDGLDLNAIISYIANSEGSTINLKAADMNGDGVVDGLDINTLIANIANNKK